MFARIKDIKVVAFDWDGTLVNSFPEIGEAFQRTLTKLNMPAMDPDVVRRHVGGGHDAMFRAIIDELGLSIDVPDKDYFWGAFYTCYQPRNIHLFEGVLASLQELKSKGFKLYIATNKPSHSFSVEYQELTVLHGLFERVLCADEYVGKPDPTMLRLICDDAGIQKHQMLMVGDTSFDVLAARANGSPVAAVACGNMRLDELTALNADILCKTTPEVCATLIDECVPV